VSFATQWQAADSTGMVYGMNPNVSSRTIFEAVDTTAPSTPAVPAQNYPVRIVRVIDNIGSPQGGDVTPSVAKRQIKIKNFTFFW
jgi:hypothetical protein